MVRSAVARISKSSRDEGKGVEGRRAIREPYYMKKTTKNHRSENGFQKGKESKISFQKDNGDKLSGTYHMRRRSSGGKTMVSPILFNMFMTNISLLGNKPLTSHALTKLSRWASRRRTSRRR